jgi:hypothetical protein
MNNKSRYILFYSNKCQHCNEFNKKLYKSNFFNEFVRICIDDPNVRKQLPPNVKTVPTIILPTNPKQYLTGKNVFVWFNTINKDATDQGSGVQPFSGDMGGYSDNFSSIENAVPQEHSFAFLGRDSDEINTPAEGSVMSASESQKVSSGVGASYERLLEQRNMEMPKLDRL